ncbi:short-chain dehydrogenase reductase [Colletotrichum incanum]|nr:short-chain dehydrogenase reductase [Colletotrichum incanum]
MPACHSNPVAFEPERDIPALAGNSRHEPAEIWLAARNFDKALAAGNEVQEHITNDPIKLLELDHTSHESVDKAADKALSQANRLDILMLNAQRYITRHTYVDKGGIQYDIVKTGAGALGADGRYYQSKLANQFTIASSDPGIVSISLAISMRHSMNIANRWLITSAEKGVRNNLWVSMAKDFKSGKHYEPVGVGCLASKEAQDDASAKESWDWTRRELQAHGA